MAASQAEQNFCSATSIARLSPNVDENKLGLSCSGLGDGRMEGLGGGITYIYRTALYGTFPGRTLFLFCLGNCHKVQSYIYIYI